jgi:hypothetical protein
MRSTWFKRDKAPSYEIYRIFDGSWTSHYIQEAFMMGAKIYYYEMSEHYPTGGEEGIKDSYYVFHKGLGGIYELDLFIRFCDNNRYGSYGKFTNHGKFLTDSGEVYDKVMELYRKDEYELSKYKLARKLMK